MIRIMEIGDKTGHCPRCSCAFLFHSKALQRIPLPYMTIPPTSGLFPKRLFLSTFPTAIDTRR